MSKVGWVHLDEPVSTNQVPREIFGFTYLITFDDGTLYVGKKQIWSVRKKHFGKKRLAAIADKRSKTYEMVVSESKWRDYEGSSQHRGDRKVIKKEILTWCWTKTELTYEETREQFCRDVLFDDNYLNANILGKFHKFER